MRTLPLPRLEEWAPSNELTRVEGWQGPLAGLLVLLLGHLLGRVERGGQGWREVQARQVRQGARVAVAHGGRSLQGVTGVVAHALLLLLRAQRRVGAASPQGAVPTLVLGKVDAARGGQQWQLQSSTETKKNACKL